MSGWNVSRISRFTEGFEAHPFHVGMDVHKKSYHLALRRVDGLSETWVSPADPVLIRRHLQSLEINIETIVYESGPTGYGLARELISAGYNVKVAAPSRIPRPVSLAAKTDRLDCIKLAEYASKNMLRGISIPSEYEEDLRCLLRRSQQLTASVVRTKNRIKSLLLAHGLSEPPGLARWSKAGIRQLQELECSAVLRCYLDSLVKELLFLQRESQEVFEQLKALTRTGIWWQRRECLKSIPGVGDRTALTFMLEIFNPERFKRAEELASYIGLAPMVRHSGENEPKGSLHPVGQTQLRSLLIEAAWMWKMKDENAVKIYNKILAKNMQPQKAICGVARKLAIIMWRIAVEGRPYYTGVELVN